jgi:hypothetical protein
MPDPLPVVARLRHLAVDEARRALAECVTVEGCAAGSVRLLDTAIASEADAAGDPSGDDQMVEEFAAWLRRIGVERRAAVSALEAAELRSTEARAALIASRAAARAIDELLVRRDTERRTAADGKAQTLLEDAARHGRVGD